MDSEILTLQVDINDDPMNQKVDAIEERLSTLQKDAKQVAEGVMPTTESLPGYNDAFMRKLADWEKSLTDIGRVRSSMEHAMSSYEQGNLSAAYKRKVEVANRSIKDLASSQNLVQELLGAFGPGMSQVFSKGLEGIVSQLTTGIRTTAMSISSEVARKLTDDEIVDRYMRSDEYGKLVHRLGQQNPDVFSHQNMRKYLMANVPMSVPQYMREAITGGSKVQFAKQPESYREMLPKSFQRIEPHAERGQVRQLGQVPHANETLSAEEISALGRIVRNNRYAADAAVKAGIVSKSGQKMYFNHATNHDMMDAMAGFIIDDMTRAAQGERKFGISDVENPNFWKNISNKRGSNKTLDGTLEAVHAMHDAFGPWLNPGRFGTSFAPFNPASGNAEYIGRITHAPRKTSRAFAEYTLDMMQAGAQISGMHPIVQGKDGKWTELTKINGPVGAKNSPTGKAITVDDFHTISMNDSMLQNIVMSSPHARRVGQNGFSDNMFYLKFSDELGDPGLSKERRAELTKQYGDLFANGYKVNGEDYIRTRISKTHAEFMKAAIVDDIGRRAKGIAYDQPLDEKTAAEVRKAGLGVLANGGYANGHNGHFDTFKPFAKTMYNQNNMATEGESLATWLGTTFGFSGNAETAKMLRQGMSENERQRIMEDYGTPNMKVVVGSFGKADMDGANWISDRISNRGFQGRTFGGKATYVPVNMMDMRAKNYQQVQMTEEAERQVAEINAQAQKEIDEANATLNGRKLRRTLSRIESRRAGTEASAIAQYGGDLVIPGAGVNGGDLYIPKDTDVIEDVNNIKHFKTHLQDDVKAGKITQEQMNEMRSRDYSRDQIYAKTTYDDANTSSRWLSKQVINSSMNAGFRDPRVQQYFDKVFFDELAWLDDDQYVRDVLFKGDQTIDLQSEKAQKTINDHIAGMWAQYNEGDRLLPTGVFKYAMAAPNPQSVINNRLKAAGIALTPEQQALDLANNQVISMESLNKQLGIVRFPATKTGNVTVDNVSAEQLIKNGGATREQIERLAKSSGIVDTKGLYFAPNSPILKLLQGEDFDGDLNGYFGLSENMNPKDAKEFSEVMRIISNASNKEVEQIWGAKPGTPEFDEAWKRQETRKEAQTRLSTPKKGGYDMANPYDAAAYLVNVPREHAMMGAAERSADMAALYYAGLNDPKMRGNLAQAIKDYESQYDVVSTNMKTDESWKRTAEQAYAADRGLSFSRMFKYANDAVQTTGENDESVRIWNGKSMEYLRDKNVDQLGLPSLFQGSIMGTLIGRMKSRQQGIDPEGGVYNWGQVLDAVKMPEGVSPESEQGKFVSMMRGVRKDFLESKYLVASNQTVDALQEQYEKAVSEIEKSIDPNAKDARQLKHEKLAAIGAQAFDNFKQFGATERNLEKAPWTQATLQQYANEAGVPISQFIGHAGFLAAAQQAQAPQSAFQRPVQASNVTVITSKTLPPEAQTPFTEQAQRTAAEMLAQETPQQQAERLLKEAGVRNRSAILDANQRDALIAAISSGDMGALMALNGIGEKTAPKVMAALQGSSLIGLKTTTPAEMQQPVATVTAPKVESKAQPEAEVVCGVCGTTYPASLGSCPNEANHPNKQKKQSKGAKQQPSAQPPAQPPTPPTPPSPPTNPPNNPPSPYGSSNPPWNGNNPPPGGPPSPPNNPPPGGPPSPPSGGNSWDAQAAQAYYGQLMGRAQEFSGKLFGEILNFEQKNNDIPQSIIKANRNDAIAARYEQQIRDFQASSDYQYLTDDQKKNMDNLISLKYGLVAKAGRDFSEMSMYSSGQLAESIGKAEEKATGAYDAQVEALNKWDEKIKEVEADQRRLMDMSKDPKYSKDLQDQFKKSADKVGDDLTKINQSRQNIGIAMQDQNQKAFDKQIEGLENRVHPGNRYQQQSRQYQEQISNIREALTNKHDAGLISDAAFSKDMSRLDDLEKQTQASALSMQQGFKAVGTSVSRSITNIASRFGRQLFQKALTEAKKFVVEFNKTMTEIQMITLKTDSQMSNLGDGLIAKAKELKISVSEISKSAATLYRQGLSDEEVSERLDVISKFSKVSGTKVDAATKLITVAMNTGLVSDPQVAADIVTALGDNAATNAAEIERGIEKAGAAAAADGTTFGQLAAMLTAITSTTQIGGSTAGRTLNTIFGRMNKIGTNELIYDENGNAVSGSAVAKLLERQGIKQYDESGNKKSSYDVLYELSQKWEKMSDAEQQQIATAIAGTRQYSNFSAIMQGMSEGKVDEYMQLVGSSTGITDQKYEIYVKSLEASLTNLKNTFDELVSDLTSKGAITGVVDTLTSMIQGVDNLTNAMGPLGAALLTVLPLLAGLTMMKVGLQTGSWQIGVAGLGVAVAGGVIAGIAGNAGPDAAERNQSYEEGYKTRIAKYDDLDRLKELRSNTNRTSTENEEYASLINKFAQTLGLTNDAAGSATYSIETLSKAIKGLSGDADEAADHVIDEAEKAKQTEFAANIANTRADTIEELESGLVEETTSRDKQLGLGNTRFNGKLWHYNLDTKEWELYSNALRSQQSWVDLGLENDKWFGLTGTMAKWAGSDDTSYSRDLEDPLVDFYYNASQAGAMGDFERNTTRSQWSNRIKAGMVTQEQLEAAFEYMDRSTPVNDNGFEARKTKSKEILSRKLGEFYDEDQIEFLANKMALDWHKNGSARDAYNNIVGTGSSFEEITTAVDNSLSDYVPSKPVKKTPYGLADVGNNGYYVDETGKQWTADEVQAYYDSQAKSDRNTAIGIMQEHNANVKAEHEADVARVEAENAAEEARVAAENTARTEAYESDVVAEAQRMYRWNDRLYSHTGEEGYVGGRAAAERAYYEDLWMQQALETYSPGTAQAIWNSLDENLKNRAISDIAWNNPFSNLSEEEQDRYFEQYGDVWDTLSPEKQAEWIEKAKATIEAPELISAEFQEIPELDESKLVGGVDATASALGELYDQGEVLPEVADKISAATDKSAKAQHKFEAVVNHFLDDAEDAYSSDQGFGTKNKVAISADNLTRLLLSGQFGTGVEGAYAFMNYLNENTEAGLDWTTLVQNSPDLQNVMTQVRRNEKTGQLEAPDDIMEQILHTVQGSSLTYGASYLTPTQKGTIARNAYTGLTEEGWFISQQAKESAQDEAWLEYQENVLNPYTARKTEIETSNVPRGAKRAELAALEREYGIPFTSKEQFIRSRSDLAAGAMSAEQASYLKAVLGEQMYSRVLEARSGGKALTQSEKDYAALVLENNVNGLTSLTASQQLRGIKDVRAAIKNGTFERDAAADQYMSQWSDWNEYAALLSKRKAGTLTAEDSKRMAVLENSLANFEQSSEIKLEVEGIKQLEDAGKVAEGLSSKIEKLRKGGKVKVQVELQIQNEAFESGQQRAKLFGGTASEQDEAAMAILGMSREDYYSNRAVNLAKAQQVDTETNQVIDGNTWLELYKAEKTPEGRQFVIDAAARAGFVQSGDSSNQTFVYTGATQANVGALVGTTHAYTEAEKNSMLSRILNGEERTVGEGGNSELYDAAVEAAGENTREYLRMVANGETPSERLKQMALSEVEEANRTRGQGYRTSAVEYEKAMLAAGNVNNAENRSALANYLGIDEDQVLELSKMSTKNGTSNALADMLAEKRETLVRDIAQGLEEEFDDLDANMEGLQGLDLGDVTDFDSLIAKIREAAASADDATAERLNAYADALEKAKNAAETDLSEAFSQASQKLTENTFETKGIKFLREAAGSYNPAINGDFIEFAKGFTTSNGETWNNEWNTATADNSFMVAASMLLKSGQMSPAQFQQLATDQLNGAGKNFDYYDLLMQAGLGANYQNGEVSGEGLRDVLESMKDNAALKPIYDELISKYPQLEDAASGSTTALKRLNEQLKADKVSDVSKYAKGVNGLSEAMEGLAQGGTDAAKAEIKLNAGMTELADQQTAINKARSKSGKQLKNMKDSGDRTLDTLADLIPEYDADQLANMSQEKLDELLNQVQPIIGEQFADTVESLWSMLPEQVINLPIGDLIHVNADGSLELTEFASTLSAEAQRVLNIIMSLLGTWATVDVRAMLSDGSINVEALLAGIKKSGVKTGGGYSRGNNSSGGSGQTETDALIEGQSHYIKRREHDVNMIQARETHYESRNNYQGYLNALEDEIAAQERLKGQYDANITALKEQLATLDEGSEEWYKCQEAIDSAEESMASIDNEIDSINSKKINITETKQANEDKPISHASTMLQLKAENYLEQGQFEKYEAVTKAQIANYANDIAVNNQQIAEWEDLLATYEEGSVDWINVRDKIWEIKEENAELENDMLKETHALEQAKIAQIATDLQNAMAPIEHEQNMLGTWSGIYQKDHQYGAYRGALASQNAYNQGQAALYQSSIDELQKQMATLEVGSQAWLDARAAIFEYQEALAQVTASIQENDAAIEESYVTELTNRYEDASRTAEHELKMAQTMAARYKEEGDYTNYEHMLEVQRDLTENELVVQKSSLADMEALFNSGKLREGSDQWKALREQIMALRETIGETENSYNSMVRQVRTTKFENAVEQFNTKDNEVQHELRMIQYDETRYQNAGELTNYGKALEWDNAAQQRRAGLIQDQIDLLKEQRDAAKDDPQLYNKIDAEIMKMEEQLASTNNTIEKNNKLIEKNQDAIRKLQQNLENTLDKEIKNREKLEREMLAGTVSAQNSMLDVIKKRYTEEFNLVKKDIENKKKALNQEKSLINERLNARKKAIDAEDKYETLAEYQKQLALISADPTRSKDAKELRRKIADLQKEISWSIAEDQAKAETEAIDDQIKALDEMVQVQTEDLNEMLENSNNFADELNQIMGGSFEDYLAWMKENSESYKNATAETRAQMEQGWHDTWLKMKGETETYWEQVAALMQNKDEFLNFMKQSQEYLNASDTGRISLERQWAEMYDQYQASLVDNAEFYDDHEVLEKISEMKDWTYKVEPVVDPTYNYGQYSTGLEYMWIRDKDDTTGVAQAAIDAAYDQYSAVVGSDASLYESQRKKEEESSVPQITIEISGSGGSGGSGGTTVTPSSSTPEAEKEQTDHGYSFTWVTSSGRTSTRSDHGFASAEAAKAAAEKEINDNMSNELNRLTGTPGTTTYDYAYNQIVDRHKQMKKSITAYKHGGLIDFTGPAWVDGSKLEPEGILSAYDTKAIQALTDVLSRVYVAPGYAPSSEYFTRGTTNIGDVNVTINQAELKDDADFEDVARRVGKAFTKQLNKDGFNLGRYAF